MTVPTSAAFAALHRAGAPLILFNVWDAGSARAVAAAGATAIATGSLSVAAAQGYPDGQALPLDLALTLAARIAASVELPVTVDFEGGYADDPQALAKNVARLAQTGAAGCNFEDQKVGGEGLFAIEEQQRRIAAARDAAPEMFINARTDLFLKEKDRSKHGGLIEAAIARAQAYAQAGASGFFAPGLVDPALIGALCAASPLPVNIMRLDAAPANAELARLGVARISHGPAPYRAMVAWLGDQARAALAQG